MKRESFDHPKMKTLARTLRVPIYAANGITARLWWFTSQYSPAGDIGRFTDEDITEAVGFDLDRSTELVESLKKAGFIEESPSHRLIIHDWAEHCEDAVHAKLARRGELFADGSEPNTRLLNTLEKERAKQEFQKRRMELEQHAHDMRMSGACNAHEPATTLALALALPLPLPEINPPNPPRGESALADVVVDSIPNSPPQPQLKPRQKAANGSPRHFDDMVLPESLSSDQMASAWREWCQHRREIRKPLKPTTVRKQLAQLVEMGPERALAALSHSMAQGWTGIYEPKSTGKPLAPVHDPHTVAEDLNQWRLAE